MIKIKHNLTATAHKNSNDTYKTVYNIQFTVGNNTLITYVNVFNDKYGYQEVGNWFYEHNRYKAYRYLIREKHKLIQEYISSNNLEFLYLK
jgi:hypothetical protein